MPCRFPVEPSYLGFRFILKFLWHLLLQKRNAFASNRTNVIPFDGYTGAEQNLSVCQTDMKIDMLFKLTWQVSILIFTDSWGRRSGCREDPPSVSRNWCSRKAAKSSPPTFSMRPWHEKRTGLGPKFTAIHLSAIHRSRHPSPLWNFVRWYYSW